MQQLFVCREILCIALAAEGLVFEMLSNIMTHFHSDDLLMRLLIKWKVAEATVPLFSHGRLQ